MKIDKDSMEEAVNDVGIGLVLSFPISYGLLKLCSYLDVSLVATSVSTSISVYFGSSCEKVYGKSLL
tara:strand:- start:409 stop:609 length:201 start_codon:yes stop_codon:yes gene_type:complete